MMDGGGGEGAGGVGVGVARACVATAPQVLVAAEVTYLRTYLNPARRVFPDHLITYLNCVSLHPPAPKGGPTRTSADVSVHRLAGFSLIT